MSGGRCPPFEDVKTDFRVPSAASAAAAAAAAATSNWLRTATYQIDNNATAAAGSTTTTTRHFAAWEQTTTTHFNGSTRRSNEGHHTHPLLAAAAASLHINSPVIRPIPNRLASPPEIKVSPQLTATSSIVKLETPPPPPPALPRPFALASTAAAASSTAEVDTSTDGNDSAFEDWEQNCSRTTPINHKTIRKWRHHQSNGKMASSTPPTTSSFAPISIMTSSPLEAGNNGLGGPLSAPSMIQSWQNGYASPNDSLFTSPASSESSKTSSKKRLKSETVTSPDSVSSIEDSSNKNIPVGIAVARQREKSSAADKNGLQSSLENSLNDSGIEMKRPVAPPPVLPPLQRHVPTSSSDSFIESWLRQPHLWPLTYPPSLSIGGYQFVKDPMTGQMFFLPGFSTPAAALWPPLTAASASSSSSASQPNSAFGLTPFQQSLMQLQQESLLVRQAGFLFGNGQQQQSPRSASPLRPSAPPPIAESPDIKVTPAPEEDIDDTLSVGDISDEIKPEEADISEATAEEAAEAKVKVKSENGLHLLAETVVNDQESKQRPSKLNLLCDAAFLSDDEGHLKSSDQEKSEFKVRSRSLDSHLLKAKNQPHSLSSEYRSPKAERNAKAFIASKSLKMSTDDFEAVIKDPSRPDEKPLKMSDWERKMRHDLADIQKKYKEKYKELYKLQHHKSPKKSTSSPTTAKKTNSMPLKKTLAPISPWLQTFKLKVNGSHNNTTTNPSSIASVTKTMTSTDHAGPDLSAITSKFRSARPNPFENLLKLSCVGKKNNEGVKKTELNEDNIEHNNVVDDDVVDIITADDHEKPKSMPVTKKEIFVLKEDLKPTSDLSKIQEDNHDADVDETDDDEDQPPLLEPMIKTSETPANITVKIKRPPSPLCEEKPLKKSKKEKKAKKAKKERRDRDHHHGHHHHKKHHKKPIVHVNDDSQAPADCIDLTKTGNKGSSNSLEANAGEIARKQINLHGPESCVIKEKDLIDGLRVLVKLEGHFHPGKIQAISPPDIYGVLVDKERGNKPHIFSREEVLREAIFEVKPPSMENLEIGTRVCAYWSHKYHHLYPGTISDMEIDPKLDPDCFINIELDDGDNRDIHVDSIRFLPPKYPLVVYDPDPLMSVTLSRRKRRQSWESGTSDGSKANKTPRVSIDEPLVQQSKNHHVHAGDLKMRIQVVSNKQRKLSGKSNSMVDNNTLPPMPVVTTNGNNFSATSKNVRKASLAQRPSISSSSDSDDGKGGIASFLPKDQVWKWADKGQKRSKGRVYHRVIERKDEKLGIGDSAVFLSTNCPDQPYIGRLESMWETASGTKNVGVRWYYHLAEVDCSQVADKQKLEKIKQPKGALFESNHYDENDVQTISHRCDVLSFDKFVHEANKQMEDEESNDKYYLAGTHNAIEKTVQFTPGVLKCDEPKCT